MPGASPPEVSTINFFISVTLAPSCIDYLFSPFYDAFFNKKIQFTNAKKSAIGVFLAP
ncbi:hypothetical protein COXBURSA331_A0449 [Coxiella burnetii RSA 331]|nr:hypothetical protein COXBURSA331_A0449 [Coxiella burnetii RSA 331]EDR36248.1 hypothetical protein COXBURSA334_1738 [Coxiella burnetii Q321]